MENDPVATALDSVIFSERLSGLHFSGFCDADFFGSCLQMTSDGDVFALEAFQRFGINHDPDLLPIIRYENHSLWLPFGMANVRAASETL